MFVKYPHVERYGNKEVEGIQNGDCYVFPKIDGTNSSVWIENGVIQAGSRTRQLTFEKDNAGFYKHIVEQDNIRVFLENYNYLRLYGEFLVPHTIKDYRDEAWRKFYVFDVYDDLKERFIPYEEYSKLLQMYNIEFIPAYRKVTNGDFDSFYRVAKETKYLLKDPEKALGEGVVIKNYDFVNEDGRYAIAKLVLEEFKEKFYANADLGGPPGIGSEKIPEKVFLDNVMTKALVDKEFAKLALDGWTSKKIGPLLNKVYECLIREELPDELLRNRYDSLNFGRLRQMSIMRVKQYKPEIF